MAVTESRVVDELQDLGFSSYEAKAYLALIAQPFPLNGYEVAKRSGVLRGTVYEVLSKLVKRGAVYEIDGASGNTEYVPLPPDGLLARLRRDFERSHQALSASMPMLAAQPEVEIVHNLLDHQSIVARALDLIDNARDSLFVSAWPVDFERILAALVRAQERGVPIASLSFGPVPAGLDNVVEHRYSGPDFVLRNIGYRIFTVVADRKYSVVGGVADGRTWGMYTDHPAAVAVSAEYVRNVIAMQTVAEILHSQGAEEFERIWHSDPTLTLIRSMGIEGSAAAADGQ